MLEIFATNLVFHEALHFIVALTLAIFLFRKFKMKQLIFVVFTATFLVDLDHLTEGFILYDPNLDWLFLFRGNLFRESGLMTIPLHSWELLPVILFVGKKMGRWPLALAVALAFTGHYLVDQLVYSKTYGMPLWEYFLTYRAWHRFNWYEICGGC